MCHAQLTILLFCSKPDPADKFSAMPLIVLSAAPALRNEAMLSHSHLSTQLIILGNALAVAEEVSIANSNFDVVVEAPPILASPTATPSKKDMTVATPIATVGFLHPDLWSVAVAAATGGRARVLFGTTAGEVEHKGDDVTSVQQLSTHFSGFYSAASSIQMESLDTSTLIAARHDPANEDADLWVATPPPPATPLSSNNARAIRLAAVLLVEAASVASVAPGMTGVVAVGHSAVRPDVPAQHTMALRGPQPHEPSTALTLQECQMHAIWRLCTAQVLLVDPADVLAHRTALIAMQAAAFRRLPVPTLTLLPPRATTQQATAASASAGDTSTAAEPTATPPTWTVVIVIGVVVVLLGAGAVVCFRRTQALRSSIAPEPRGRRSVLATGIAGAWGGEAWQPPSWAPWSGPPVPV